MRDWKWRRAILLLLALLLGQWLLAGCTLCSKRLPLYRDTEAKGPPPSGQALLITDPELAKAVGVAPQLSLEAGARWAPEQPSYQSDYYRFSVDQVDGKVVYQGLCMDTTPTYTVEVRPGPRQIQVRLDLFGPWGHEKIVEVTKTTLEPGWVYFLRPDYEALQNRQLVLKIDLIPRAYDAGLRRRVQDWNRTHYQGRNLAD